MKTIDIILLIPLLFGAYLGYKKGFVTMLFKFAALLLGIVIGFKLVHVGSVMLEPHIGNANGFLPLISFIAIVISVILIVNLLGKILKAILDMTLLGSFDNLAGAIFNLSRWAFLAGTILWLMEEGGVGLPSTQTEGAFIYPILVQVAPQMIDFFSQLMPFASDAVEYIKVIKV